MSVEVAEAFELTVRSLDQTPCVLDVCEENILQFAGFSSVRPTERDLHLVLPESDAATVLRVLEEHHAVRAAFAVRCELVNFKKLLLHVVREASGLEKDLRRASSFFFADLVNPTDPTEQARYIEISSTLSSCRGALQVLNDARIFTKLICRLPRHPAMSCDELLSSLPGLSPPPCASANQ